MANEFVHIELSTGDLAAAKKFYASIFNWKLEDMPGMGYTMVDTGKGKTGGGMQPVQMPNQPPAWMPYVAVDDVKSTIAKAKAAGANVIVDYQEIGTMGAIGIFIDPQGAALGVWAAGKKAPAPTAPRGTRSGKKAAAKKKPAAKKAAPKKKPAAKKKKK